LEAVVSQFQPRQDANPTDDQQFEHFQPYSRKIAQKEMEMGKSFLVLLATILIVQSTFIGASNIPGTKSPEEKGGEAAKADEDPLTDDRININLNRGHAESYGKTKV